MTTDENVSKAILSSLQGMADTGPEPLLPLINFKLQKFGIVLTEDQLVTDIIASGNNSAIHTKTHIVISKWDAVEAEWGVGTELKSAERRSRIYEYLELSPVSQQKLNTEFPIANDGNVFIGSEAPWQPWYTDSFRAEHDFYWQAYRGVLEKKGWQPESLASLDNATTAIVARLANPCAPDSYQTKGLVVGHVQSGKTANFTGMIAKSIDAGYRLIIVLTGTIELLRGQTQRRLDMELIGEENILGGLDRNDFELVKDVDYIGNDDADWKAGNFLKHNIDFHTSDVPAIKRLTTQSKDYRALKIGIDALDFRRTNELKDNRKNVYDPVNLYHVDARVAIIKKNKAALGNLIKDLKSIHAKLGEIPALIIDDEADQASVNTIRPTQAEVKERRTINKLITELINMMPRAQYVGYTATPFANVFVDPDDSEDLFPKDFILALEPAPDYMGGKAFHDLEALDDVERRNKSISNEAAHVRDLTSDEHLELGEIQEALDAFVLSGAIKKWREAQQPKLSFRHHTMLVHESVKTGEHEALAEKIRGVWNASEYSSSAGMRRLRELYEADFVPVNQARDWPNAELPKDFTDIERHIGEVLSLIQADNDPVVIVNGSSASEYDAMDFQKRPYWRILVGGTKLSRGFTVEGLTISYYRRKAFAADTLMQMGRWFGYRNGYADLVRLYIARAVPGPYKRVYDLYDAFTATVQDEEEFRAQLQMFATLDEDGHPQVRPIDVPPMVFQQLPWLKPTATNKMYNAVLDHQSEGGRLKDFARQAPRDDAGEVNKSHFEAVAPLLKGLSAPAEFGYWDSAAKAQRTFQAQWVRVSAAEVAAALARFEWADGYTFEPTLRSMQMFMDVGTLADWIILVPHLTTAEFRTVDGFRVPVITRSRRKDRAGFSGSSFRQRDAIERIAGNSEARGGELAAQLSSATTGGLLLTFASDPEEGADREPKNLPEPADARNIATLFSLAFPQKAAPRGRIGFRVLNEDAREKPIIDAV